VRRITTIPGMISTGCFFIVSSWWIIQLSALPQLTGVPVGEFSLTAARTVLTLQLLITALCTPFWAIPSNASVPLQQSMRQLLAPVLFVVFPAWPFLAVLSMITGKSIAVFAMAELTVLGAGLGIGLIAQFTRRLSLSLEISRLVLTTMGIFAAALCWQFRYAWLGWVEL
jgi:hypothetical protein